jgi:hypothetical protein
MPVSSGFSLRSEKVKVLLEAGVWAVQSTPLINADGKVFGVISTHFAAPHRPQDRELHTGCPIPASGSSQIDRRQHPDGLPLAPPEQLVDQSQWQVAWAIVLASLISSADRK